MVLQDEQSETMSLLKMEQGQFVNDAQQES